MIKFFRKIRYNLMSENKTGKYFKYAIGEIVLVVIGILIALSINNWNESRKNKILELKTLVDLNKEFKQNHKVLELVLESKTNANNEFREYLRIITSDSLSWKRKASREEPDVAGFSWTQKNAMLNSILNLGRVELFQNDSLKYKLTDWKYLTNNYKKWETDYDENILTNLYKIKSNYTTGSLLPQSLLTEEKVNVQVTPVIKQVNDNLKKQLIRDYKYYEALSRVINGLTIQVRVLLRAKKMSEDIQLFLEKEIASREK